MSLFTDWDKMASSRANYSTMHVLPKPSCKSLRRGDQGGVELDEVTSFTDHISLPFFQPK
jgi:hypothetical protein